jgi:regulator of PEP synthase PpsR (kinase-PPPase family)
MYELKKIIIISDGTGKTAKRLMDAVVAQYQEKQVDLTLENIFQEVRTREQFDRILTRINREYLVLYSLISQEMSGYAHDTLEQRGILHLDVLEPMLSTMSKFLGVHPDYKPGLLQIIDDRYYRKIDAIGYTVEHDDGRGHLIEQADVVLLGVSRTCKTPISMFLACNFGLKVANIPIVHDGFSLDHVKQRIAGVPKHVIYGLVMAPDVLMRVREERMQYLTGNGPAQFNLQQYCNLQTIREEIKFSSNFFVDEQIETIDVTRRAIEEVSRTVIDKLRRVV